MKRYSVILLFVAFGSALSEGASGPADLVLRNCTVITIEDSMPQASAVAISRERIVWVGDEKDLQQWIGAKTRVLVLDGAFVYPGLIDSHAHIVSLGRSRQTIDLVGTPDKQKILKLVQERVRKAKPGEWIVGHGWDQNDWPDKKFPTAADLDTVAPENPVVLERIDGHAYWVNHVTLQRAGITASTKDPDGGFIHRDPKGKPAGVLIDNAVSLVDRMMQSPPIDQIAEQTRVALREAAGKGLTMIHDAGTGDLELRAFQMLAKNNDLPVRIYSMVWMPGDFGESFLKSGPTNDDSYLDVRSTKLVVDGAMGSRGAAMLEPYRDDPENSGLVRWESDDLMRVLRAAKEKGIQVGVHAIGDRANRMVLDAYEQVGVEGLRWRIEHAQLLAAPEIPRFAKLGVISSMQPIHATSDMPWFADRVGPERTATGAYVWRSLLNDGALIAAGSDAPVEDINPLWGIYAAITRQDHKGDPPGGWLPEQRVSPKEALRMYTLSAAYAAFREQELGSIKAGKLADLVVLPENILTCDPKKLITMKVLYTIVGGQIRYQAPPPQ